MDDDAVLRAWIALERFETNTLGRLDRSARARAPQQRRYADDVEPRDPLPWEPGHIAYGQPGTTDKVEWRHTVHLGHVDVGRGYEQVEARFPTADADAAALEREHRRSRGSSAALIAFATTADGRPVLDSLQVSSAAWSIARTLRLGVDHAKWLDGFDDAVDDLRAAFVRIARADDDDAADEQAPGEDAEPETEDVDPDEEPIGSVPLTWDHLLRLLGAARSILELGDELTVRPIARTSSWLESRRVPPGSGDTLLNSFAVDDLERVAARLAKHPAGEALERYLHASAIARDEAGDRIDVDEALSSVSELLRPTRMPAGRWPADATHDLAMGQQLALNLALADDAPAIVGVNGPPGTGKTTMLRDLIAGIVVDRADAIAALGSPDQAFGKTISEDRGERTFRATRLAPGIAGHEILLACATNAAAQNVSLELPARGAIDGEFAPDRSETPAYFADFATTALRAGAENDEREASRRSGRDPEQLGLLGDFDPVLAPARGEQGSEAWAFVAARLGRRSFCKDFVQHLWWGERSGSFGRGPHVAPTDRAATGLRELFARKPEKVAAAWADAKKRYLAARAEVDRLVDEREDHARALASPAALLAERDELVAQAEQREGSVLELETERGELRAQAPALAAAYEAAREAVAKVGPAPPGHIRKRLSPSARAKDAVRQTAEAARADAEGALKRTLDRITVVERKLDAIARERRGDADRLAAIEGDLARRERLRSGGDVASEDEPDWVATDERWFAEAERRDLRAPWSDEALNRARTTCFLAALELHELTLRANAQAVRRNLGVVMDLISGRAAGLSQPITLAAWQTLFLLTPVVSTTFASLPRLLAGLGQEDLGWVLVDEAGQAQPQQAVGALWRARQAVIVGDPLQLEPVSTLPNSLAAAIRDHYGVPREFISPEASVQRLADAVTQWGGHRGDDELWVGVPMNVHRRCEEPIFGLVNAIAYGGRMVNATRPRPAHPALHVETCWLHVPSGGAVDGHWCHDEGVRLDRLLEYLSGMRSGARTHDGVDFSEVFAVSPFRDVARHLRERARHPAYAGMVGDTIHTIQGREADTVILVLGGNPGRPGARRWAAQKPNLLNVAASRARQRLYVIGDHDAWTEQPYFSELGVLPRHPPVEHVAATRR